MTRTSKKQRIILAALECIERDGMHSLTVRAIARKAKVNVAAVNYYFGAKGRLVEEALSFSLYATVTKNIEAIERRYDDPYLVIRAWLLDLFEGIIRFPNLSKAHLYGPFVDNDYSGALVHWLNGFSERLAGKLAGLALKDGGDRAAKAITAQLISAVFFLALTPRMFDDFLHVDFTRAKQREQYVDILLSHFFPVAPNE